MAKKGISYFQLELSAFQYTDAYKALLFAQPETYLIWEDYALYIYVSAGKYTSAQIQVTPKTISIFKESRRASNDFIYNWNGVVREYDGARFCESPEEFALLTAIGDWFRAQLLSIQNEKREFEFLSEIDFSKRLGISFVEHLSFQQKVKLFTRDIRKFYGYEVELRLTDYFSHEFWHTGSCAKMTVTLENTHIHFQYLLHKQQVSIYCNSTVVIDEHPMLLKVVKMLMRERAYGQIAQVYLQTEARTRREGVI